MTQSDSLMDINAIEQLRTRAGFSQRDVCRAAEVHPTTYSALKAGRREGNARTYRKLQAALDELIAERNSGLSTIGRNS